MRTAGVDLSLWVVLTTLAVLTCALVLGHLSEVGYRRAAEKRGLVLLKQWLSPAQLAQYENHGYFELTGGVTLEIVVDVDDFVGMPRKQSL